MMENVWRIIKKDWRLTWMPVVAVGALQIVAGLSSLLMHPDSEVSTLVPVVRIIALASLLLPIMALVRQDIVADERQDWLIRPIPRAHMLAAKLASLLLMVHGPRLLGDWLSALISGASPAHALWIAVIQGTLVLVAFTIPWMACGSMCARTSTMLAETAVLTIALIAAEWRGLRGYEWLLQYSFIGLLLLASIAGLAFVYLLRNIAFARETTRAVLLFAVIAMVLPFSLTMGIQNRWTQNAATRSIAVHYTPADAQVDAAHVPMRITGVFEGERLEIHAVYSLPARKNLLAAPWAMLTREGNDLLFQQRVRPLRGPVELAYYMTLLRSTGVQGFPALDGETHFSGMGRCTTRGYYEEGSLTLECLDDTKMVGCYSIALEFPNDPTQNKSMEPCSSTFEPPVKYRWGLSAISSNYRRFTFNFREGGKTIRLDNPRLSAGRFLVTTYEPVGDVTRYVTVPDPGQ